MRRLKRILLALGLLAFAANTASAHVAASDGDSFAVPLCGPTTGLVIILDTDGDAPETTDHAECGLCALAAAPPPDQPLLNAPALATPDQSRLRAGVSPRVPNWPGAPTRGPPLQT